jgi:hypothetical protein
MHPARIFGLIVLVTGVILQPIGWAYIHWITPLSFGCIVIGCVAFLIGLRMERDVVGGGGSGRAMPGDIHGYSGQLDGGRSTSYESHHSSSSSSSSD